MKSVRVLAGILICGVLFTQLVTAAPAAAADRVRAVVDLSEQRMYFYVNGVMRGRWKVSTGRRGYRTPTGRFRAKRLEVDWYSTKYDWAPMPYSVFFHGGYAVHGTNQIRRLGRPASHGCVRLHPDNAATLFYAIMDAGLRNSRIVVRR